MLEPGASLQRGYVIERILGKGGMGAVYLARHATLSRRVAIKETVLHLDNPEDQARASQQFQQEAEILASLEHPNLVDVKDFFEEDGSWFLVMSFVDGSTLETIVNEAPGPLPIDQVLDWADQICEVLIYLHEHRPPVIVRDLKPNNIMLDARDRIRVIDFGIARVYEAGSETAMFVKGAGTVGFAPVEQFGGGTTDPRTDLYSLGATLYALLTRTLPPWSVALATGEATLTPPSVMNPRITPALEGVIMRLMSLRKEHRHQTAREAREALKGIRQGLTEDPAPHVAVPQRFCTACGCTLLPSAPNCPGCGRPPSGASGGLVTPSSPTGHHSFPSATPGPVSPPPGPSSGSPGGWAGPALLPGSAPFPGGPPGPAYAAPVGGPQVSPSYPPVAPPRQPGGAPFAGAPAGPIVGLPYPGGGSPQGGPQQPHPSHGPPGISRGGPPSYPPPSIPQDAPAFGGPGGPQQGPPSYPPPNMPQGGPAFGGPGGPQQGPPSYPPPNMPHGGPAVGGPGGPQQGPPSYPPPGMPQGRPPAFGGPGRLQQSPPSYPPPSMPQSGPPAFGGPGGPQQGPPSYPPPGMPQGGPAFVGPGRPQQGPPSYPSLGVPQGGPPSFGGLGGPQQGPPSHAGPVMGPAAISRGPARNSPPSWSPPPPPRPQETRSGLSPVLIFLIVLAVGLIVWGATTYFSSRSDPPAKSTKKLPPAQDSLRGLHRGHLAERDPLPHCQLPAPPAFHSLGRPS